MTITEFLLERIAEDEAAALPFRNELGEVKSWQADEIGGVVRYVGPRAFGLPDRLGTFDTHLEAAHVGRWHPSRVLAECAAKRAIIRQHEAWPVLLEETEQPLISARPNNLEELSYSVSRHMAWLTEREYTKRFGTEAPTAPMIRTLAEVYRDHPDYQEEWR